MSGKPRNKRISNAKIRRQQHLLEVTVRADKARAMRNRAVAAFVCKTIFFSAVIVGLYLGGKELLRRFLWENPDYLVTEIRVPPDGALQRDQILEATGLREGVNIFTIDTKKARVALDTLPQVERAEIQRILPNRIEVNIVERRPIAWVTQSADENPTASDRSWLIDARGVVMKTKRMLEEYYHLPHISGEPVANFIPGQRITTVEMQAALELVRLNTDNTRWQARNIDLAKRYCLVVTDQNHARITFGLDDIGAQLDRLFRCLDRADAVKREIQTVNLLVKRNTPVTFEEPEPLETADPPKTVAPPTVTSATPSAPTAAKATPVIPRAVAVSSTPVPSPARPKSETRSTGRGKSSSPRSSVRKPFRP
jgi:cell division septal protein FtsQ